MTAGSECDVTVTSHGNRDFPKPKHKQTKTKAGQIDQADRRGNGTPVIPELNHVAAILPESDSKLADGAKSFLKKRAFVDFKMFFIFYHKTVFFFF